MFHLTMPSGGTPLTAIRCATVVFLEQVKTIGIATSVEVSTRSGGEDALTWKGVLDGPRVGQRLEAYPDTTRVLVTCDLRCEDSDGREFTISDGLTFWGQLAEDDSPPDEPLEINLTLDTDVYLPKSLGEDRDNRVLAARNAPRFNRFLASFLRETGATVESVSAGDYRGQVDATGIVLP
ncbi:MAG TPA: hypothetical protein VN253_12830 [Kofleriaceae bacterium]|nr:hypothetical protein [Kofleriaceae bacterium]